MAGSGVEPPPREATRRLTVDVRDSLHRKMKIRAAITGRSMVDEIRDLLEAHYQDDD
ncbi:FitA-like ribbon-helix-helix domain-containing protein [Mycobacterium intracellulare]|uniref:FitA-like ribbon-helix-helix domain-containing protein n=1 Tax=Mycobacterium intracellulare TaxID=1767 RepID=UPI000B28C57F|nr:hypothetical protein [Mycobacterium intracellulare]